MANINRTIFTADNQAIIHHIFKNAKSNNKNDRFYNGHEICRISDSTKQFFPFPPDLPQYAINAILDRITEIYISSRNDTFHDHAVDLSKQFPESKIICKYTMESDWYFKQTTVEYLAGNDTIVKEEYSPMLADDMDFLRRALGNDADMVIDRVMHFVKLLFGNALITEGETIKYSFLTNNHKIEAEIPFGPHYGISIYRVCHETKTNYVEITDEDNNLPF